MKLYREVKIESAEQAEALPVRTPIIIGPFVAMCPDNESFWGMSYSDADYTSRELVKSFPDYDLTALVPIEAEEEHQASHGVSVLHGTTVTWPARTRLVTPWEEAPPVQD